MSFAARPFLVFLLVSSALYLWSTTTMSAPDSASAPPSALPPLEVRVKTASIIPPPPSTPPITAVAVQVSVHNKADTPVTLLNWGSPLDPMAKALGVFEIRDADTNEPVALNTIKVGRKLPPSREDFVEIPAGGALDADVTIPMVPLVEGRRYMIQAKGWWQAVWETGFANVASEDLEKMTNALRGEVESEPVPVQVA
ncbi:hypothetical protein BJX61DRAFT_502336 [Aspergillus egyptiacus]|nr:hypothetical protein BJX61DRAFT_502336 [Aspergillus egyptiacus]